MDLNHHFHRQQVALMRAAAAPCAVTRAAHHAAAARHADRIVLLQREKGARILRPAPRAGAAA